MTSTREARETSTYLAWQSHVGVRMQTSRLRESYDNRANGAGVQLVDCTGLVLALWRLRLAAQMSRAIDGSSVRVGPALEAFNISLPWLAKLRHVTMHFDEYALGTDKRRNTIGDPPRLIAARDLWEFRARADGFEWLGVHLDYDRVEQAARSLYDAIQADNNSHL